MASSETHYVNFAMLLIVFGVILLLISLIEGFTMLIAFYKNVIVIHTINDIRVNVIRVVFNFVLPFLGGLLLVLAGATINSFARINTYRRAATAEKVRRDRARTHIINMVLSADERKVLDIVKESPEGILQSDIVIKTGFSKVKVHRVLKKLEVNGIIRRGRFGITNKVFAD
ncbi:MAG: helix-turn-helix transcriptional regulator [Candidatus Micrarchaeia archaeon]